MSSFTSPLIVSPMPDGVRWKLVRSFKYHVGSKYSRNVITVPAGFVTDFASIPEITSPLITVAAIILYLFGITGPAFILLVIVSLLACFRRWGKSGKPAVLHDWLYQSKQVSRAMADLTFLEAMYISGVSGWRRNAIFWAVRAFGWIGYSKNNLKRHQHGI